MAANSLIEAFDASVRQIARGQSIAEVVAQYPQFAEELRVMLAAAAVVPRYELSQAEVDAARARIQPAIDDLIDGFPDRGLPPLVIPLAIIGVIVVIVLLYLAGQTSGLLAPPTATITPTATATPTATLTEIPSATATETNSPTASPTATPPASMTPAPTATLPAQACAQNVVLEGVIEAIQGNQIVVYNYFVPVSDPALYTVGTNVRVEGCICAGNSCDELRGASVIIPTRLPLVVPVGGPAETGGGSQAGSDSGQSSDDDDDDDGDDG